jgi:hypothetical protein
VETIELEAHMIREESVDVESNDAFEEDQESDVIPASWPIRRASNVTEYCCVLPVINPVSNSTNNFFNAPGIRFDGKNMPFE